MTETAVMTETAEKEAIRAKRTAELLAKLQAGFTSGDPNFGASKECQAIVDEMQSLKATKKAAAPIDPKFAEEKKGINVFLFGAEGDTASGQQAKLAEKLNAHLTKAFPMLKEKGASIEVILKVKGAGKSATSATGTSTSTKYARILHRTESGERCRKGKHPAGLDPQALASLEKLKAAYPAEAAQIDETFGTGEKRNTLWNNSKNKEGVGDTKKVYVNLSDGTKLCLQS